MKILILVVCLLIGNGLIGQTTMTFLADKDNSMYAENVNLSNGQGPEIFMGTTSGGNMRRALIRFDVDSIPIGSIVTAVEMTLNCVKSQGSQPVDLHKALQDWGEGASIAGPPGGMGAPAQPGDATWGFRFFNTLSWTTPGGDFDASVSASSISNTGANSIFMSGSMVADVQQWVDGTVSNFGWIVRGNETANQTAARFNSRESASNPPMLVVTYMPPVSPCATQDTLSGMIASGTITYPNQLVIEGTVQADSIVVIEAKDVVALIADFEVFLNGDLEIQVDSCQ